MKEKTLLIICLLFAFCNSKKSEENRSLKQFIENVYADSSFQSSGQLLSEPFLKSTTNKQKIICFDLAIGTSNKMVDITDLEKEKIIELTITKSEINKLEQDFQFIKHDCKRIDTSISYCSGHLTILGFFANQNLTRNYIYYSIMDCKKSMYASFLSTYELQKNNWKEIKLVEMDRN